MAIDFGIQKATNRRDSSWPVLLSKKQAQESGVVVRLDPLINPSLALESVAKKDRREKARKEPRLEKENRKGKNATPSCVNVPLRATAILVKDRQFQLHTPKADLPAVQALPGGPILCNPQ